MDLEDPLLMGGLNLSNFRYGGKRRVRQPLDSESDQADDESSDADPARRPQRPRTSAPVAPDATTPASVDQPEGTRR